MQVEDKVECLLAVSLVGDSHTLGLIKRSREARAETRKVQEGEEMRGAGRGPNEGAKLLSLEHFLYSPAAFLILISPLKSFSVPLCRTVGVYTYSLHAFLISLYLSLSVPPVGFSSVHILCFIFSGFSIVYNSLHTSCHRQM